VTGLSFVCHGGGAVHARVTRVVCQLNSNSDCCGERRCWMRRSQRPRLLQHSESWFSSSSRSDPALTPLLAFAVHCLGANDIEDRRSGNTDRLYRMTLDGLRTRVRACSPAGGTGTSRVAQPSECNLAFCCGAAQDERQRPFDRLGLAGTSVCGAPKPKHRQGARLTRTSDMLDRSTTALSKSDSIPPAEPRGMSCRMFDWKPGKRTKCWPTKDRLH